MNTDELGSGIVAIQRKARFADTPLEVWATRLQQLIASQPGIRGSVTVDDVHPVGTAAGGSNGTFLFDADFDLGSGRASHALVLRFLPVQGLFHRYDVRGQFELQRALESTDVPVPKQLWLDEQGTFLTRPGYVMQQVRGVSAPMTWMTSGVIADASVDGRQEMTRQYVQALVKVHAVDWRSIGLQWLDGRAVGSRPIEREVNWYWEALNWAHQGEYLQPLARVRDWLIAHEPADVDVVLCHGDANLGNYLFEDTQITAVVDWEMSFLGAPECDLSFIKVGDAIIQGDTPWPEGALRYDEMRAEYEKLSGRKLRHMEYFELFSAYRLAVINVLAMKHFPKEVLAAFMPVLQRGPALCLERATALGVRLAEANVAMQTS